MYRKLFTCALLLAALTAFVAAPGSAMAYGALCGPLGVLHYNKEKSYGGYVLYTNHQGGTPRL